MKVTAHVLISRGYGLVLQASQWRDELLKVADEMDADEQGDDYLSKPKLHAVITVEFEVDDAVFERPPALEVRGRVVTRTVAR